MEAGESCLRQQRWRKGCRLNFQIRQYNEEPDMPVGSELVESTEPYGTPGTCPIHVKVMWRLRKASLSFLGPAVKMRKARESLWGGKHYAEGWENASWKQGHQSFGTEMVGSHARMKVVQRGRESPRQRKRAKVLRQEQAWLAQGTARRGQERVRVMAGSTSLTEAKLKESCDSQKHAGTYFQRGNCPRGCFVLNP